MKKQKTNVKSIVKHLNDLYDKVSELNPATKPQGTNLSWDDYYKAVQDIKDFKNQEVHIR